MKEHDWLSNDPEKRDGSDNEPDRLEFGARDQRAQRHRCNHCNVEAETNATNELSC